ncbi:segregation and condensation protein B [Saccharomonospora amisosensis]|uniref:Segregation and condensation protein B n=1 Tax=Saccharomonospora amisosensis TaxID=1128677 RepID=A0A7X5UPX7_9PSEU|nr:SMC-Scp complex subunit ScpB [Saccharomonospora amisosensis]NIJ11563.1 segregation and condensation protein B [Saccharomonospora amisosensis]
MNESYGWTEGAPDPEVAAEPSGAGEHGRVDAPDTAVTATNGTDGTNGTDRGDGTDGTDGTDGAGPEGAGDAADTSGEPEDRIGGEPEDRIGGEPEDRIGGEPVAVSADRELPELTSDADLACALEALLLVVDSPAAEESLAGALEQPVDRVTEMLRTMAEDLRDRGSGIDLRRVGEGWRFFTRDTYAPFVEKLLLDGQRSKLTRAALETLAVIAYRQPVTRSRVAAVRGVNVDGVIRTLLARGLIEESGTDPETGGTLYVTTELFLERLGLSSLNDLPPIAPLLPEVDSIDDI